MRLQISSRLAIFALLELAAEAERQMSVAEIGDKYGASAHHLAKVMSTLGRAGLVQSVRGVGGGYRFTGNARRTTLLEIIELFEEVSPGRTDEGGRRTEAGEALHDILAEIDEIARATLGSVTISTMLKLIERRRSRKADRRPPTRALA
jgi:Rrf2 family protein